MSLKEVLMQRGSKKYVFATSDCERRRVKVDVGIFMKYLSNREQISAQLRNMKNIT